MEKEQAKNEFLQIAKDNIKREGIDKLLEYLQKSDFFDAPASSRFHSNYSGGLCNHSINVYKRFIQNLKVEYGVDWQKTMSLESATIIALFHDVCKVDYYKEELKNVKEDGVWVQKPYYTVDEALPYGHGEKSVYIISGFMKLTREEAMAINWHMGGFDSRVKGGYYGIDTVYYKYPTALLFHVSDIQATYLDETTSG